MISIWKVLESLPPDLKKQANQLLKIAEADNGHFFVKKTLRELRSTADFIKSSNGVSNFAALEDFLRRHNPSEKMLVHGLLNAKTDEETRMVVSTCNRELMKSRKAVRDAIQQVAPRHLKEYDKEQKAVAKRNKALKEARNPKRQPGCSRPLFPQESQFVYTGE